MKNRTNNKKGFSLAVAVVLCLFLVMVTGTITTLAIYQQKETGAELNTRQAYTSAKSALEMINANDVLKKIIEGNPGVLPSDVGEAHSVYFALYYDASGNLCVSPPFYNTADILNWMETNHTLNYLGDGTYFKIVKNADGTYNMSALSQEGKYTPDDSNFGDLSFVFESYSKMKVEPATGVVVPTNPPTSPPTSPSTEPPTIPVPPTSNGVTPFFMCGQQTAFTLDSETNYNYNLLGEYINQDGSFVFNVHRENTAKPSTSYFPIVFNYSAVKFDSDASSRCSLKAVDTDIMFLGKTTSKQTKTIMGDGLSSDASDICIYSQNDVFSCDLSARTVVIGGNIALRDDNGTADIRIASGTKVWFTKDCTIYRFSKTTGYNNIKTIKAGWYYVNGGLCNGSYKDAPQEDKTVNLYNSIIYLEPLNESKFVIHSAMETCSVANNSHILNSKGEFTNDGEYYSSTDTPSIRNSWNDSVIYCAPNVTPTANGSHYLYCGKGFNFLWYNKADMVINSNVNLNIMCNDIGLTIGSKTSEGSASNILDGSAGGNSFWLKGYKDGDTSGGFNLMVYNDITVKFRNGADVVTYTIKQNGYDSSGNLLTGENRKPYTHGGNLNLFSMEAKNYFEPTSEMSVKDDVKITTMKTMKKSDGLKFGLLAAPIFTTSCKFGGASTDLDHKDLSSASSVTLSDNGTSDILKSTYSRVTADVLTIDISKLKGDLKVIGKNYSGYMYFNMNKLTEIVNDSGEATITLGIGAYKVPYDSNGVDICDADTWKNLKTGGYVTITSETVVKIKEGSYF